MFSDNDGSACRSAQALPGLLRSVFEFTVPRKASSI